MKAFILSIVAMAIIAFAYFSYNSKNQTTLDIQNADTAKVAVEIAKERATQTIDAAVEDADFNMIDGTEKLPPAANEEVGETVEESIDKIDEIVKDAVDDIEEEVK